MKTAGPLVRRVAVVLAAPLALAGCKTVADEAPNVRLGQATLQLASGLPGGTAQLLSSGSEVNITIAVAGLSPGADGSGVIVVSRPGFVSSAI